jgi:EmrB/QacA subfamily drug resistance transporter
VTARRTIVVFVGLNLGMMLSTIDGTMVATAVPAIVRDVGGFSRQAWLVTAYMLAMVAAMPLYGKIGDLYGRKRVFLFAVVTFLGGSALCGGARTMNELLAFRAVQGLGAGGLSTVAMAIIADIVPARQLGRWLGYQGAMFAASVLGPFVGGLFTDTISWRWAFYVNLPLGLVAIGIVVTQLHLPERVVAHAIDWAGSALLTSALVCLVLIVSVGGEDVAWLSPAIAALAGATVVLFTLFLRQERRVPEPVVPLGLFDDPLIRVASVLNFVGGLMFWVGIYFMPQFAQEVAGVSATRSAFVLTPVLLTSAIGTLIAGRRVERVGRYRAWPIAGSVLMVIGVLLLSLLRQDSAIVVAALYAGVLGTGVGFAMQTSLLAMQNRVEHRDLGTVTSTGLLFRVLGGTVGTPVFVGILNAGLDGSRSPAAYADALPAVFLAAVPIGLLSIVMALRLPEVPLREHAHALLAPETV